MNTRHRPALQYGRKVIELGEALNQDDNTRDEAVAILRGLIEEIRLELVEGQLSVYLVGNLA